MIWQRNPLNRPAQPRSEDCIRIEFFGLPGSGKTTVALKVHSILSANHPGLVFAPDLFKDTSGTLIRVTSKLRLILADFIGDRAGAVAAKKALVYRQARLRDMLRVVFTFATVASLYAVLRRRRLSAVLDQGTLQAIWSLQIRASDQDSSALAKDMLNTAASSGHIHISIETPAEVCAKRLAARISQHSRLQTSGAAHDPSAWQSADRLRQTILGNLRAAYQSHGVRPLIISVDGLSKADETADQIVAALRRSVPALALRPAPQDCGMAG